MTVQILKGDCRDVLRTLPDESVHCVVTSPPYFGLRDYGVAGQIGLEATPEAFTAELVRVFAELRRVLRKDGTAWLNIGDSYATSAAGKTKDDAFRTTGLTGGLGTSRVANTSSRAAPKDYALANKQLVGIPWRVAFALQADGWYLRQDIIWSKPNPMPESVRDRCTKAHEYLFLLSKSERYHYDYAAIQEPFAYGGDVRMKTAYAEGTEKRVGSEYRAPVNQEGRNKRSVWEVTTQPFAEAHFATFPPALIEPCILAGCPKGGTVLDPFGGAGTTAMVADRNGRNAIHIDISADYCAMAERRIRGDAGMFAEVTA